MTEKHPQFGAVVTTGTKEATHVCMCKLDGDKDEVCGQLFSLKFKNESKGSYMASVVTAHLSKVHGKTSTVFKLRSIQKMAALALPASTVPISIAAESGTGGPRALKPAEKVWTQSGLKKFVVKTGITPAALNKMKSKRG